MPHLTLEYTNNPPRVDACRAERQAGIGHTMPRLTSAALLIIGMQQGINDLRLGNRNNPHAEDNIRRLASVWRAAPRPVVHARHIARSCDSVFFPGQPGVEFQQAFAPLPGEHVIENSVPDAFINTGLERWLHARGIEQLVIVGAGTNNAVESTVRSAGNLGFSVYVPADAAFAFDKHDYEGMRRSADEVHAMSLANLHGEYATVTGSDPLLSACRWMSAS